MLLCIYTILTAQQDTVKVNATMHTATVYYGYGAELEHKAITNVTSNTKYIIIDKLSTQLDQNSLQIGCPETVSLLAQQYSIYSPVVKPKPVNPLAKKVADSMAVLYKKIKVIQNKTDIETAIINSTNKLIENTIATSGNKNAITPEVLKLIDYNNEKIAKCKQVIFDNTMQVVDLQAELDAINQRLQAILNTITDALSDDEKPYGRITLQVVCRNSIQAKLALSYYTTQAGWQPIYDIRVNSTTNAINLVYKASVIQNTGIHWDNTKLTLSTGTPNFTTTAPTFNPWYLQLYVPQLYKSMQQQSLSELVVTGLGANTIQGYKKKENTNADEDTYELEEKSVTPSTLDNYTSLKQGLLNTNFEIDLPYDIMSNGLPHSINIKEQEITSQLKNYAIPKLDADAYLLTEITNWENLDLIPGNANIIMDDTYIGKSFVDPNTTADTLNLSLGKDKRVAVKRTLVKDATTTKTTADYTKQTFTYELTIKNNKQKAINLILKDQYPLSNVKEVVVTLDNTGGALVNDELGVLNWQMNILPGKVEKVRFSYTVKYPRDKKIMNLK